MRFSIKSRVESLIKRGRVLAAIRKLQRFTKDKADYRQTYNTLTELESKYIQIERDSKSGVIDYATFDRERSKIRSAVLDINNEIVELKETKDRKFLWMLLTGILIPILGIVIPYIIIDNQDCPDFDDGNCKLLVFQFNQGDDFNNVADEINYALQSDDYYKNVLTSRKYQGEEKISPAVVEDKVDQCNANIALYGLASEEGDGIFLRINPYPEKPQLTTYVDEVKDTLQSILNTSSFVANDKIKLMLNLLVCDNCGCEVKEAEIIEMAGDLNEIERENLLSLLASYQYNKLEYASSERTLTLMIQSMLGGIKIFAMRGKVRDDQKKYEPAYKDYTYYLDEKPENHNVRLKRFTSAYNLLMTSEWHPRYAGYVDVAQEDLHLLRGNITEQEYTVAKRQLQEMLDLRDKHTADSSGTPITDTPDDPDPTIEKCNFTFQVQNSSEENLKDAIINIKDLNPIATDHMGLVEVRDIPCEELLDRYFTVTKSGYLPYRSQIIEGRVQIILEAMPIEPLICAFAGEVLDEKGEPIFSATIRVDGLPTMRTNREGIFKSAEKPCEELRGSNFTIVANGFITLQSTIDDMEMSIIMEAEPEVELCTLSGYVRDPSGLPISKANVSIYGLPNVLTNSQGYFKSKNVECSSLLGKKYTISAEGYNQLNQVIGQGTLIVNHTLRKKSKTYEIAGLVSSSLNKKGLSRVTISLDGNNFCKTNSKGSFSCDYEYTGGSLVRSLSLNRSGFHDKDTRINLNNAKKLKFQMNPTALNGKVVDTKGNPVARATVKINGLKNVFTDKNGAYGFKMPQSFQYIGNIKVSRKGFNSKSVSLNQYKTIELQPVKLDYLHIIVTKAAYNPKDKKYINIPAKDVQVIINNKVVGTTDRKGKLQFNITNRLNQTISIDLKGVGEFQIPSQKLPMKVRLVRNGQQVKISHSVYVVE